MPGVRTPGGHRRFRASDLAAWTLGNQTIALAAQTEALVQSTVGYTRQEKANHHVSDEPWYVAFELEEN
jgi:hypothetical protein